MRPPFLPFIAGSLSVLLFIVFLVSPLSVLAQQPTPLAKSVEVVVTNVDVVVTDKKGKPVTDLRKEEFELKEDGVRQVLTHLALVDHNAPVASAETTAPRPGPAGSPAPSSPKVYLLILLDQLHLTVANRNRALQSLAEYLPKAVGPRVVAQVITWDRALRVRGPFTDDGLYLAKLLRSLKEESTLGELPARERDALYRQIDSAVMPPPPPSPGSRAQSQDMRALLVPAAVGNIRSWCDQRDHELDSTLSAARATVEALAGVEGRKILFFVTENLSPTPGRDLWDHFRNAVMTVGNVPGASPTDLSQLTYKTFDRTESFQELARTANASSVSLVTVEAGGLTFDTKMSAQFAGTIFPTDESLGKMDAENALRLLADQTGGAAVIGRNDLAAALGTLEAGWTTYYSLGFESSNASPGRVRTLSVSVKRPGVVVRSRRTLVERTWEQKIADAVLSGLHMPRTYNPLGASLHVGQATRSGNIFLVPLEFSIPFENLALIPNGKLARGRILLTIAAGTLDGKTSGVSTQRGLIEIPEAETDAGKPIVYTATVKLRPGEQIVSVALTDETTQITSYVQSAMSIRDLDREGKPRTP